MELELILAYDRLTYMCLIGQFLDFVHVVTFHFVSTHNNNIKIPLVVLSLKKYMTAYAIDLRRKLFQS